VPTSMASNRSFVAGGIGNFLRTADQSSVDYTDFPKAPTNSVWSDQRSS
jgi:hypothetical protein